MSPGMMEGAPPLPPERLVTLANWQQPPFNRWAFQHMNELIPSARIRRGDGPVLELPRAERDLDGLTFGTEHGEMTVAELLATTYTDGFLVLHEGRIVTEQYFNGLRPDVPHLLMSVSKSVTGTLAGAMRLDVTAKVTDILPELAGTSFAGATVRQLLDMRTGTRYVEDYESPDADIADSDRVYQWRPGDGSPVPGDALAYFATLGNDSPHGGPFRYRSILVDVMAWVIERVGQARFPELVARELWQPMGAEFDAEVTVDRHGNSMADGGISATLRDVGRFGLVALGRGRANQRQVVPRDWFDDTITGAPDGPAAFTAGDGADGYPSGAHYRNFWWVRDPMTPFFNAAGIHGQHVFVHEPAQVVVVKLSTWPTALNTPMVRATIAGATAIAEALAR